jgi:TonB family protein
MTLRCLNLLLLTIMLSNASFSQERIEISHKSGSKYSLHIETYFVLKSDTSIKDGTYQQFINDKLNIRGTYKNGQKDSVWEYYSYDAQKNQFTISRKWYSQGVKTGKWEFFNRQGKAEAAYDFTTDQVYYPQSEDKDTTTCYYQTGSGDWVRGNLDRRPFQLYGSVEWQRYLNYNFRYPDEAVEKELMGTVLIGITVDESGHAANFVVYQNAAPSLDHEALRVVSVYDHDFIPAMKDGKKVKSLFIMPVTFKLVRGN